MASTTSNAGLTVSVSVAGLNKVVSLLDDAMSNDFSQMSVSTTANVGPGSLAEWGPDDCYMGNVGITLTNGGIQNAQLTAGTLTQDSNGQGLFTCSFLADTFNVNFPEWSEAYTIVQTGDRGPPIMHQISNSCGNYSMSTGVNVLTSFTITGTSGGWEINNFTSNAAATNANLLPLPSGSVLQNAPTGFCDQDNTIQNSTGSALASGMNFQGSTSNALQNVLATIPASGTFADTNITVDFSQTGSDLYFPTGNGGVQIGCAGNVYVAGNMVAVDTLSATPLPLAPPPAQNDVTYNLSDYFMTGVAASFYQTGQLFHQITTNDAAINATSNILTTPYYANTVPILSDNYPNCSFVVNVNTIDQPTVTFSSCWEVTPASLTSLANNGIPSNVISDINSFGPIGYYTNYTMFYDILQNAIGADNMINYWNDMEPAFSTLAATCIVPSSIDIVINSYNNSTDISVLNFTADMSMVLNNFYLSAATDNSNTLGALSFNVQTLQSSNINLVNTTLSANINANDINFLWGSELQNAATAVLDLFATAGAPLPRVQNFSLSGNEAIELNVGYISLTTDFILV